MPGVRKSGYVLLSMSSVKKMLMFDWVYGHLEKNTFAEMKFINADKTRFQVPWIHKSNRKWNANAAAVFRAWAEYKGKEDNFSFTRAKTNFRMAMKYQPNIKEVKQTKESKDKTGKNNKRKSYDEEKCVKVYEITQNNDSPRKKQKKTYAEVPTPLGSISDDCSSSGTGFPSTSCTIKSENSFPSTYCENQFHNIHNYTFPENSLQLPSELMNLPENILDEIGSFLPEDGPFVKLPPYQELVRSSTVQQIPKQYDNTTRYLPLQPPCENICDMAVSSTDDFYTINSPLGLSPDEISSPGDNISLYSYPERSPDLESSCQVSSSTYFTDDHLAYCCSDIEAFERMEDFVKLLVRNFG